MANLEEPQHGESAAAPDSLVKRIYENIHNPAEFCRRYREEDLKGSFKYYVRAVALSFLIQITALVILALIPRADDDVLVGAVFGGLQPTLFVILFIIFCVPMFLFYLLYPFIDGLFTHIGVVIVGGKQGLDKTFQAVIYYLVPYFIIPSLLVFCLIPATILYNLISLDSGLSGFILVFAFVILGIVFLWIIIISVITLRELQCLSTLRAVFAALFPFILMVAVMLLFIGFNAGMMVVFSGVSQYDEGNDSPGVGNAVKSPYILTADELPASIQNQKIREENFEIFELEAEKFGCLEMYNIQYSRHPKISVATGIIYQNIMTFPPGKSSEMMAAEVARYIPEPSGAIQPLPCPSLGDESACFKSKETEVADGNEYDCYFLVFKKGDIVETFSTIGPDADFTLVKEIAILSAAKIPGPDRTKSVPIPTTVVVTTPAPAGMTTVSFYDELRPGVDPASIQPGHSAGYAVTFLFTSIDPAEVNIRLDNVERGSTPLMVTDVPLGSHTMYAYREGYAPLHTLIYANSGQSFLERTIQLDRNLTE